MIKKIILRTLLLLVIALFYCSSTNAIEPKKSIDDYAKNFITKIQLGKVDSAVACIDSEFQNSSAKELLQNISNEIRYKELKTITVLGYQEQTIWSTDENKNIYRINYEYNYNNLFYIFEIVISNQNDRLSVAGFNANIAKTSTSETIYPSSPIFGVLHICFILLIGLIIGFIIYTIIDILKSKLKRKWCWVLLSLLGFCALSLNWATADISFKFFTIKLFSFSFTQMDISSPWLLDVSIPLGAIIYWIKKPRIIFEMESKERLDLLRARETKQASVIE